MVAEVRILLLQPKLSELEKEVKGMTIEKGISYLNNQKKKVIESFVKELRKRLGNNIISIRLFGSKVKGDFKEDSDIDMFILVKEKREARNEISDIAADYFWRHRLGVRIDGSQPSDRGSNPRGATNFI